MRSLPPLPSLRALHRRLLVWSSLMIVTAASAQTEHLPWTNVLPNGADTLAEVGDTISVHWEDQGIEATSYGMRGLVMLRIDPHHREVLSSYDVRVKVALDIISNPDHGHYVSGDDYTGSSTATFELGFRKNGLDSVLLREPDSLLSRDLDEGGIRIVDFRGAHDLRMIILQVSVNDGSGYVNVNELPRNLYFDLRLDWELVRELDMVAPGDFTITPMDCDSNNTGGSPVDELLVTWGSVAGAYDYHLEWTWVDDYDEDGTSILDDDDLLLDFEHNATRVTTARTYYRVPLLFDRGWVVFRVRAMGHDGADPFAPVYGPWNYVDGTPVTHTVGEVSSALRLQITDLERHRSDMNWQLTSTYAEGGKRKEVMTYADGTLRSRQAVTRNNSLYVPIVGETIYDIVGRPAVDILPVPVVRTQGCPGYADDPLWAPIDFYPWFNGEDDGTANGTVAPFDHSDIVAGDGCGVSGTKMDPDNGSELYYSEQHMALSAGDVLTGQPSFLPLSKGYPYAQTEYTRDNTGRVRSKGGVGDAFRVSGDHVVRSFYGKPEQVRLDRLFGSEAGYASHYQKNITVDPNGQASVVYIDGAGRTVATSLVGASPPNLDPLPSYPSDTTELLTDLFCGQPSLACEQNVLQPLVPALIFTDQLAVPSDATYTFSYDLAVPQVTDPCMEVCLQCTYNLRFSLIDQCGDEHWPAPWRSVTVGEYLNEGSLMFSCREAPGSPLDLIDDTIGVSIPLPKGEYVLTKTLTLDTTARNAYVNELVQHGEEYLSLACYIPFDSLLAQHEAAVDTAGCNIGCAACYKALGSLDDFLKDGGDEATYEAMKANCDELCREPSWCEVAYKNMLIDMSPGGQYAAYVLNPDGTATTNDRTSVFYHDPGWSLLAQRFFGWVGYTYYPDPSHGIDVYTTPLWRQPRLLVDEQLVPEYRDQFGERTRILLSFIDDVYDPPIMETDTAHVFTDGTGQLYTYPENLRDLADFVLAMQAGWERSLIFYHPEYCYWKECRKYDEKTTSSEEMTTDDFDTYLLHHDRQSAIADSLLSDSISLSSFDRVLFVSGVFGDHVDPIFNGDAFPEVSSALTERVEHYWSPDGGTTWLNMMEVAAITARCGGDFTMYPGFDCANFGYDDGTIDDAVLEQEWAAFKGMYLGEKYRLQKIAMDNVVRNCDCAGLNWCIGAENEDNDNWRQRMYQYTSLPPDYWEDWWTLPIHAHCQVCNEYTADYFGEKVRRFAEPDQFGNNGSSLQEAAYQNYMATGLCPIAASFMALFQELAGNNELDGNNVPLNDYAGYHSIYLTDHNYAPPGPTPADRLVWSGTPTDQLITSKISFADSSTSCLVSLSNTYTETGFWDDIVQVVSMDVLTASTFTLRVRYMNDDGIVVDGDVSGSIGPCFDLITCDFPEVCNTNDLGYGLQALMGMLAIDDGSGDRLGSGGVLMTFGLSPGTASAWSLLAPQLRGPFGAGASPGNIMWSWDSGTMTFRLGIASPPVPPEFRIKVLGVSTSVGFDITTDLPDVEFVENLRSTGYHLFNVDLLDADHDLLGTLHGGLYFRPAGGVSKEMPVGECDYPEPFGCEGIEYRRLDDLLDLIVDVLGHGGPDYDGDPGESPLMTDDLLHLLCPECDPYEGIWSPEERPGRAEHRNPTLPSQIITDLEWYDCINIHLQIDSGATFVAVDDVRPVGGQDAEGNYHVWLMQLLDENGAAVGTIRLNVLCMGLKLCDPCPADSIPFTYQEIADLFQEEERPQRSRSDEVFRTYRSYVAAVEAFKATPGRKGEVKTARLKEFRGRGYERATDAYLAFLTHFDPALDDPEWAQDIGTFLLKHGAGTNVQYAFTRYAKATEAYNARAVRANAPPLVPVDLQEFAGLVVASRIQDYVDLLRPLPTNGTVAPELVAWTAQQQGPEAADDACLLKYRNEYLPAYAAFEARQRQAGHPMLMRMLSIEDVRKGGLCGSDEGTTAWDIHIATLLDTIDPARALSSLVAHPAVTIPITLQQAQPPCSTDVQNLWAIVSAFNGSDYVTQTGDSLPDLYPDPWGENLYDRSWHCSCFNAYSTYLMAYLNWGISDPALPPVMTIDEFPACHYEPPTDTCAIAYQQYLDGINAFEEWLIEHKRECEIDIADEALFTAQGLCYCVDDYVAYLKYTLSNDKLSTSECLQASSIEANFRCQPPTPCPPTEVPFTPIIQAPPENPCVEDLMTNAAMNAQLDSAQQAERLTLQLSEAYNTTCMQAFERFSMGFPDSEHHFTLYYYDQAGNLIRTIPPAGVEQKAFTSSFAEEASAIAADRANGTHTVFTEHRMPSDIVYNSLGAPVRQDMPDHDRMKVWEVDTCSGLPALLNITGSHFTGNGRGWLTGYRDDGPHERGYLYTTTDGGSSWERVSGLVAADLNNVHFPLPTMTPYGLIGYAVGAEGTLLKTQDGGQTWDMLTALAGKGELFDVHFRDEDHGVVVGTQGRGWYTSNGGTSFVQFSFSGCGDLYAVTFTDDIYVIAGTTTDGKSGVIRVYDESLGPGTPGSLGATTADLTCAAPATSGSAFAGGDLGVLLHSADNGQTWSTVASRTLDGFRDMAFLNDDEGIALFDSAGTGVLRYTTTHGQEWVPLAMGGPDLQRLMVYEKSGSVLKAIAVGAQGRVVRIVIGNGTGIGYDVMQQAIAPNSLGDPTTGDLTCVWAGFEGDQLRCVAGTSNGHVFWTPDLLATPVHWHLQEGVFTSTAVVGAAGYPMTGFVNLVLVGADHRKREAQIQLSTESWTASALSSTFYQTVQVHPTGHAVVYNRNLHAVQVYDLVDPTLPFSALSITHSGTIPLNTVNALAILGFDSKVLTVGEAGGINVGTFNTNPPSTCSWSDRSRSVRPLPLHDIAEGERTAAGDQGTIFRFNGTNWEAVPTARLASVHGIAVTPFTTYILVGPGGHADQVDLSTPGTVTDLMIPQSLDLHDVHVNYTDVRIAASGGAIYRRDGISGPWTILPFAGGDVKGLGPVPGMPYVFAVGQHAMVHVLVPPPFPLTGVWRFALPDVFTPPLNDVSFTPTGNGYVVGDGATVRWTADNGLTWQLVTMTPPTSADMNAVFVTGPGEGLAVGNNGTAGTLAHGAWSGISGFTGTHLLDVAVAANGSAVIAGDILGSGRYFTRNAGGSAWTTYNTPKRLNAAWSFKPAGFGTDRENEFLIGGNADSGGGWARLLTFNESGAYVPGDDHNVALPSGSGNITSLFFHDHVAGYATTDIGRIYHTTKGTSIDHTTFAWDTIPHLMNDGIEGQSDPAITGLHTIGFNDRFHGFAGGCYDCGSNATSPPERYARVIHDETELFSVRLWYDKLGRVVLSQNTKQHSPAIDDVPTRFSYTLYDDLSRIEEAGEVTVSDLTFFDCFGSMAQDGNQPFLVDQDVLRSVIGYYPRTEVAHTYYDKPLSAIIAGAFTASTQENLRLRVASSTYEDVYDGDSLTYDHATHYSYDIHGNVKELLQDLPSFAYDLTGDSTDASRFKHIRYTYDLISGNVLQVDYETGRPDQFHHRYAYDADNRIDRVETSRNNVLWREDARYFYYPHGPLQRVELGENKVQGLDYAYTLQGWLKGINSDLLMPSNDMGNDAQAGDVNALIGRDAYGLSLGYYGDADYAAIDAARWSSTPDRPFAAVGSSGTLAMEERPLFNGNIAHTVNTLAPFGGYSDSPMAPGQVLAMAYRYDQLNRLKRARGIEGLGSGNQWESVSDPVVFRYLSTYNYDANGNLATLERFDRDQNQYDDLFYGYHSAPTGGPLRNRLYHVEDNADAVDAFANDIHDLPYEATAFIDPFDTTGQVATANNYRYDAMGNLIHDENALIDSITWTVTGKVRGVDQRSGSGKNDLRFAYSADGQRVMKEVLDDGGTPQTRDHYVRDAQGNIMALYHYQLGESSMHISERPIYGSQRVGTDGYGLELAGAPAYDTLADPLGYIHYELTDHLGNVASVVSDEVLGVDTDGDLAYDYFQPNILTAQGYEPFGSLLPARHYRKGTERIEHGATVVDEDFEGATVVSNTVNGWYSEGLPDVTLSVDASVTDRLKVATDRVFMGGHFVFPTLSGEVYAVEFDLDPAGNTIYYEVRSAAGGVIAGTSGSMSSSGTVSFSFTATDHSSRLKVYKGGPDLVPVQFFIDNITVTGAKQVMSYADHRFGFNGKEKDNEIHGATGTSIDFGARLYGSREGRWWSLDPSANDYPSISPYAFAGLNPIAFKDPDGKKIVIFYDSGEKNADGSPRRSAYEYGSGIEVPNNKFVQQTVAALNLLSTVTDVSGYDGTPSPAEIVSDLVGRREYVFISESMQRMSDQTPVDNGAYARVNFNPSFGMSAIDYTGSGEGSDSGFMPPFAGLNHELVHAWHALKDIDDYRSNIRRIVPFDNDDGGIDFNKRSFTNMEEYRTSMNDNALMGYFGLGARKSYVGEDYYYRSSTDLSPATKYEDLNPNPGATEVPVDYSKSVFK